MDNAELERTLARLSELHAKCRIGEPWRMDKQPHDYADGTTHFNHVRQTAYVSGEPVTVTIATYVTPELAELLVTTHNNLPEIIRLARLGLKV